MSEKRVASEDKLEQVKTKKAKKADCDAYITLTGGEIDHIFYVSVNRSNFVDFKSHINEDNDVFEDKPVIYEHTLNNTAELAGYMLAIEELNDYLTETNKLTYLQPNKNILCCEYHLIPALIDILNGLGALSVFNDTYNPMMDKEDDVWRECENDQTKFWRENTDMVSTAFVNNKVDIDEVFDSKNDIGKRRAFLNDVLAYMQEYQTHAGFLTTLCKSGECRSELGELIAEDYMTAKHNHPTLDADKSNLGLSTKYFNRLGLISDVNHTKPRPETYVLLVAISQIAKHHKFVCNNAELGIVQRQASATTYVKDYAFNYKGKLSLRWAVVFNDIYLVKMLPCANCGCEETHFLSNKLNKSVDPHSLIGYKYAVCNSCYDQIVYN